MTGTQSRRGNWRRKKGERELEGQFCEAHPNPSLLPTQSFSLPAKMSRTLIFSTSTTCCKFNFQDPPLSLLEKECRKIKEPNREEVNSIRSLNTGLYS